jgi:hypothetical protein
VVWLGTLVFGPGQLELARRAVLEHRLVPHLLETLEVRQEDDEVFFLINL